ncbi:hypothetical protein M408DRAFT_30006 [Serendipita vermifera MAFF 305830]|uniref:Uncharacterized protein n=1 Tax=Serendipita vermifera MAFF 305830 TaxID=933852 RepID=A0A0C2WTR3_SERVB|nr:hypothetical protein M408DRAFT_30006 [Serendipita vermifera MAFF 305830]
MERDFTVERDFRHQSLVSRSVLFNQVFSIIAHDGDGVPTWIKDANGKYLPQMRYLCNLKADMSGLQGSLQTLHGPLGPYYDIRYTVSIRLGGTKLQARLQWKENGSFREGPITIIPGNLT